jgi:hypothetical protein
MSAFDRIWSVFAGRGAKSAMEREMEEEVRQHLQNRADDLERNEARFSEW